MPFPKPLQLEYIAFYICASLYIASRIVYLCSTPRASCRNEKISYSRGERRCAFSLYLWQTNPLFSSLARSDRYTENSSFVPTVFRQGDKGCNWYAVLGGALDVRIKQETTKVSWNFFLINSLFVVRPQSLFALLILSFLLSLLFLKNGNFIVSFLPGTKTKATSFNPGVRVAWLQYDKGNITILRDISILMIC